jgi:hypothetical protein
MTCTECQDSLEEYLDGELGTKNTAAVDEHLKTCTGCTMELNQLRAELAVFQLNGSDIEVTERLWAGVQARLETQDHSFTHQRRSRSAGWLSGLFSAPRVSVPVAVGLVLTAVIVTTFVVKRLPQVEKESVAVRNVTNKENTERTEGSDLNRSQAVAKLAASEFNGRPKESKPQQSISNTRTSRVARSSESKTPEQLVRDAEKKYLAAIGILSRDIERQQSQLDEPTRMKFEQALASIDRTIGATRKAVRQHPTDPVAVQYMLAAYARKVDVLREMAGRGAF